MADNLLARGVSKLRISATYFYKLRTACTVVGKDLDKFTKQDVEKVMAHVRAAGNRPGTINQYGKVLKVFYRWLEDVDRGEQAPKIVRWIQKEPEHTSVKKEDLLTMEEITRMIAAAGTPMRKCLISLIWETGARPGELRSIQLKDIHINGSKVKIYVRGKSKKIRGNRIVFAYRSLRLLTEWLAIHPRKGNPEAFPFVVMDGSRPIDGHYLNKILKMAGKDAGISKKINAYRFRHTRLTDVYAKMGHQLAKAYAGHADGSKM